MAAEMQAGDQGVRLDGLRGISVFHSRKGLTNRMAHVKTCDGVAAGILPAVEPGILPGGAGVRVYAGISQLLSGRQDAALYGRQDAWPLRGWNRTFAFRRLPSCC